MNATATVFAALLVAAAVLLATRSLVAALSAQGQGVGSPPETIGRLGAAEAEVAALRSRLGDLETTLDTRFRKLAGMVAVGRRRDRAGDVDGEDSAEAAPGIGNLTEGQQLDLLRRLGAGIAPPAPAPTGDNHTGHIRPMHRRRA